MLLSASCVNQIPLVSQTSSGSRPEIQSRNPRPKQRNTVGHYVEGRAASPDFELTQVRGFQDTTANTLSEVAMEGHGDSNLLLGWFCQVLRRDTLRGGPHRRRIAVQHKSGDHHDGLRSHNVEPDGRR